MDDDDLPTIDWEALSSAHVFANGKGGVGKTTLSSNFAGLVAADGGRVLLIDVNAQGNIGRDLGYRKTAIDDNGESLFESLRTGTPLKPIAGVRSNLDVVVGGTALKSAPAMLMTAYPLQQERQALALATCLAPIARDYDIVVIDSAPENEHLQQIALSAARWLTIPTKSDQASIADGLGGIAKEAGRVRRRVNPHLQLLGVVMFATGSASAQIRRRAQQWIRDELGANADTYLFESFIRHSEAVGQDARSHGRLVHELEAAAANNPRFWDLRAGRVSNTTVVSATSASVAEDLAAFARELLTRAAELDNA
ncbi:ParA family protein [Streptomyces sp. NPDC058394]|uniref:ParA family protein n=1 Tax=Streptomyces sp. NPDC058394 TaxID=3346477 RepID=UPI00365ED1B0